MKARLSLILGVVLLSSAAIKGEETPTVASSIQFPKASIYFGVTIPRTGLGGDFDGNRLYRGSDFVVAVPDVDDDWGLGVNAGVKTWTDSKFGLAFEGSILTSKHDTQFGGASGEARYTSINTDVKLFPVASRLQPFFLVGLSLPFVEFKEGYTNINSGEKRDATYAGLGLSAGLGLEAYLTQNFAINGALIFRRQSFNSVDYEGSNSHLDDEIVSSRLTAQIAANYYFKLW